MSIFDAIKLHPFDMFSLGPDILKSSTYTTSNNLSSGWKNTEGHPSGSGMIKPTSFNMASQYCSQSPPESG